MPRRTQDSHPLTSAPTLIRLLIVRVGGEERFFPLDVARRITRLARNFSEGETLKEDSIDESIAVLKEFASLLHRHHVRSLMLPATGVIRRARNAGDFLQKIREATGI